MRPFFRRTLSQRFRELPVFQHLNALERRLRKTQLPAPKCLGTAPSKHSNSSRIRVQAMQNERRKTASRHLWNPLKKQNFRHLNALERRFRKTQLPAPKCLGTAPSKHPNSSRIRVQAMQNERRKSASRHLWGSLKQQNFQRLTALERAFETLEQQQDSCRGHTKRAPKKCFTSPLESIKTTKLPAPKCLGSAPSKHPNSSAGFVSRPCNTSAEKLLHVTFGIH